MNYNTQKLICRICCSSIMANCRLIKLGHVLVEGCYCMVPTLPHRWQSYYCCGKTLLKFCKGCYYVVPTLPVRWQSYYCCNKNCLKVFQTYAVWHFHISDYKKQAEIYRNSQTAGLNHVINHVKQQYGNLGVKIFPLNVIFHLSLRHIF